MRSTLAHGSPRARCAAARSRLVFLSFVAFACCVSGCSRLGSQLLLHWALPPAPRPQACHSGSSAPGPGAWGALGDPAGEVGSSLSSAGLALTQDCHCRGSSFRGHRGSCHCPAFAPKALLRTPGSAWLAPRSCRRTQLLRPVTHHGAGGLAPGAARSQPWRPAPLLYHMSHPEWARWWRQQA